MEFNFENLRKIAPMCFKDKAIRNIVEANEVNKKRENKTINEILVLEPTNRHYFCNECGKHTSHVVEVVEDDDGKIFQHSTCECGVTDKTYLGR